MAWRLPRKEWHAGKVNKAAGNKRAFRKLITSNEQPGVLAYRGRQPIAWCAIAPREKYPALTRSRVLRPVDGQSVWSITCLFVLKPYRRCGVSSRLLQEAAAFAAKKGARTVEGYPVQPTMDRTPDPFIWTGVPSAFRKAGFKEVARRSRTRPIMRLVVKDA
jgi:GNAT superfamily N-acetyltransferase